MGAKVSVDSDLRFWLPANFYGTDLNTKFKIEQVWSNGSVMLSAPGVSDITVWNHVDVTFIDIPQLTVEEVTAIVMNPEFYPKFYVPAKHRESHLNKLTDAINGALNPHLDVMVPFIKEQPVRRVVSAANLYMHPLLPKGEVLITGARHADDVMCGVLDVIEHAYDIILLDHKQGFIDQWGEFMDRREALQVVQASGQYFDPKRNVATDELYSEGIC
jgi:hypothetical protein